MLIWIVFIPERLDWWYHNLLVILCKDLKEFPKIILDLRDWYAYGYVQHKLRKCVSVLLRIAQKYVIGDFRVNGRIPLCEFWGSCSSIAEDLCLLGCHSLSSDKYVVPTFWTIVMGLSSGSRRRRRRRLGMLRDSVKCWEVLAPRHSITSQKTQIFWMSIVTVYRMFG